MRLFVPIMMAGILTMGVVASDYYKHLFGEFGGKNTEDVDEEKNDDAYGPFDAARGYKKPPPMPKHFPIYRENRSTSISNRNGTSRSGPIDVMNMRTRKSRKRQSYKNPYTK